MPTPASPPPHRPDPAAWSKERKIYLAVGVVLLLVAAVLLALSL